MNCADWEERIALYTGGDLPDGRTAEVERHLRECAGCQVFASGLRQSLELLRGAHAGDVPAAAYAAVRMRVMGAVERRRRVRWAWARVAVAAVAVLLAIGGVNRTMRVEKLPLVALAPPPVPEVPPGTPKHVASGAAPRRVRPRPHPAAKPETVLVKLETDNPDVVIYWIAETKGELK